MVQFLTNRMSDTTYLKDVDDRYQDLEDAFVYFFGVPVGENMAGQVLDVDEDGIILDIIRSAAPGGVVTGPGWRFRDTTNDDEFLVVCRDGYLRLYKNISTQSAPSWAEENKLDLSDGTWDIISAAEIGTGCAIYSPYGGVDFRTAAFMEFEFEFFDDGNYFDPGTDKTKLIIPADGRYNVQWSANFAITGKVYQVELMTTLYLNGSPVMEMASGRKEVVDVGGDPIQAGVGVGGDWTFGALEADDYLQFEFEVWSWNDDVSAILQGHAMIERIA